MKYKFAKLNNGGKLFYVKNNINKSTMIDVLFNCGARCDTIPGLAHFCEHMFFTGTKNLNKTEMWAKYRSFIKSNAYTSLREIAFTAQLFTNELKDYLNTVCMMINESTFTEEAVEKERKVINQEIAEYYDKHADIAYNINTYNVFELPAFKERVTVTGSKASIAKIGSKDIKQFVKTYFVANNLEIYVSSPLNINKVKKIVNESLSNKLAINKNLPELKVNFYDVKNNNFIKTKPEKINKCYLTINFCFPKNIFDYDFLIKCDVMRAIINDSALGFAKILRTQKSLVYGAYFSYGRYENNSMLSLNCECEKENINDIITTLADYVKATLQDGFTEEQLKKVKRSFKHGMLIKNPSVSALINRLYEYRWEGKILDNKKFKKAKLKMTVEECNATFNEIFKNSHVSLSLYGEFDKQTLPSLKELNNMFNFKN